MQYDAVVNLRSDASPQCIFCHALFTAAWLQSDLPNVGITELFIRLHQGNCITVAATGNDQAGECWRYETRRHLYQCRQYQKYSKSNKSKTEHIVHPKYKGQQALDLPATTKSRAHIISSAHDIRSNNAQKMLMSSTTSLAGKLNDANPRLSQFKNNLTCMAQTPVAKLQKHILSCPISI